MGFEQIWRRVYVRMWRRGSFTKLSKMQPTGQGLWCYLLTCPDSLPLPGAIVSGKAGLAEDLSWSPEDLARCWAELEREGMAEADWVAKLIWLPGAPAHNLPQSVMVAVGWGTAWRSLPDCDLKWRIKREVVEALKEGPRGAGEGFLRGCEAKKPGHDDDEYGDQDDTGAKIVRCKAEEGPDQEAGITCWLRCKRGLWVALTDERAAELQRKYQAVNVLRELTRVGGVAYWMATVKEADRKWPGKVSVWRCVGSWLDRENARILARGGRPFVQPAPQGASKTVETTSGFGADFARFASEPTWPAYEDYYRERLDKGQTPVGYESWKRDHGSA